MKNNKLYEQFKDLSQDELYKSLLKAAEKGDLEVIQYLLENKDLKHKVSISYINHSNPFIYACNCGHLDIIEYFVNSSDPQGPGYCLEIINRGLIQACIKGNNEVIKFLLSSPKLKNHADINADKGTPLYLLVSDGDLDIIRYLLSSPDLKNHADINAIDGSILVEACGQGHLEVVKYLLTSPELKEHANISAQNNMPFKKACMEGHLEIVKYLVTNPEFENKINLKKRASSYFKDALMCGQLNVINYFIFDLNINKTKTIQHFLEKNPNEKVENWFTLREVNKSLNKDLPQNSVLQKKNKNKI
jgi:ankyrin repeat protein